MMRAVAAMTTLLALSASASAHCHRVWHYRTAQPGCGMHARPPALHYGRAAFVARVAPATERKVMHIGTIPGTTLPFDTSPPVVSGQGGDGPTTSDLDMLRGAMLSQRAQELK